MIRNRRLGGVLIPVGLRNVESRESNEFVLLRQVFDNEGSEYTRPGFCNRPSQLLIALFLNVFEIVTKVIRHNIDSDRDFYFGIRRT